MIKRHFGVITDNPSPRIMYELNKKFYQNSKKDLGKIFYINISKLINQKILEKKTRKELKSLSKVFHIYTPKNYYDLYHFLSKNKFILSVSLGRTFKYFVTWYILKKTNQKLLYLLNLGLISTKKNYYTNSFFKNFKKRINNFFNTNISFFIYRLFVFLKIFPHIDFIFEASKIFAKGFENSPAKKIENFLSIKNLALYKKIILINSRAYDEVIDSIKHIDEKFITFLDSGFDHPDRKRFDKKATKQERILYYQNLEKILKKFSKIYNKKIIFCSHPKSDIHIIKKYLRNIKIVKFKTRFYILRSKLIFFHESSSVLDAIIIKKKLWCLQSNTMGKFFKHRNNLYPNFIGCLSSDMSSLLRLSSTEIKKLVKNYNFKSFNRKILGYLVKNQKSLNYINKCIKEKKMLSQNNTNIFGRQEIILFLKENLNNN